MSEGEGHRWTGRGSRAEMRMGGEGLSRADVNPSPRPADFAIRGDGDQAWLPRHGARGACLPHTPQGHGPRTITL